MTALCLVLATAAHALPAYEEVKAAHRPSDVLILDRHGEVVHRLRVDKSVRRGPWVPLADMPDLIRHP
jgi:penicillin-binding protein 1C